MSVAAWSDLAELWTNHMLDTGCRYSAANNSNATLKLQQAIEDCGDLPSGGTVLIPAGLTLRTGSLWLRSNLTLRVEVGAALVGTATGTGDTPESISDAPMVCSSSWQMTPLSNAF